MSRNAVIDFETVSSLDLSKVGLRRYLADPKARIYSLAWTFDGEHIYEWNAAHQDDPSVLMSSDVFLWAHNAPFDFTVWNHFWGENLGYITANKGACSMAMCSFHGLPESLSNVGAFLNLGSKIEEGKVYMKKLHAGKELTQEEHNEFIEYNKQDVRLTWQVLDKLNWGVDWSDHEKKIWLMTQHMNKLGWKLNMPLVKKIVLFRERLNVWGKEGIKEITEGKITTPKSIKLRDWIEEQCGRLYKSLDKNAVNRLVNDQSLPQNVRDMLFFKQSCGGSATVKANKFNERGYEGRIHDEFVYCGAANTNRFSSRGTQLHNIIREGVPSDNAAVRLTTLELPTNKPLTIPRSRLWGKKYEKGLRSCLMADEGEMLYIADFTGIEMRIVMWYAGETSVLDSIRQGGDPYVEFAKMIFKNPNLTKKDKYERTQAKAAMLGCGYQMGWERFRGYVANFGLDFPDEQAIELVEAYREIYWRVPRVWSNINYGFRSTLEQKTPHVLWGGTRYPLIWTKWGDDPLPHIKLYGAHRSPLYYYNPKIRKVGKWEEMIADRANKKKDNLYGGKLFENVVQSTARHIFANAMLRAQSAGYKIVGQVHDEIVISAPQGHEKELMKLLSQADPHLPGLPISLDMGVRKYYTKI